MEHPEKDYTFKYVDKIYDLYIEGGYRNFLSKRITNFSCTLFLMCYMYFLVYYFRVKCLDGKCVIDISYNYFCKDNIFCRFIISFQILLEIIYICWAFYSFTIQHNDMKEAHTFFLRKGINVDKTISWKSLINLIVHKNNINLYNQRLKKRGAFDKKIIKTLDIGPSSIIFTPYSLWAFKVATEDSHSVEESKKRTYFIILCMFISLPFILIMRTTRIIIREFIYYKSGFKKNWRDWSLYSKTMFKKMDELPHKFKARLKSIEPKINIALNYSPTYKKDIFFHCATFVSGSFLLPIIIITAYYDQDMIVKFNSLAIEHDCIWFVALFSSIIYFTRLKEKEHLSIEKNIGKIKNRIGKNIYEKIFSQNNNSLDDIKIFGILFPSRFYLCIIDILSVLTTPFYLIFYILPNLEKFCDGYFEFPDFGEMDSSTDLDISSSSEDIETKNIYSKPCISHQNYSQPCSPHQNYSQPGSPQQNYSQPCSPQQNYSQCRPQQQIICPAIPYSEIEL